MVIWQYRTLAQHAASDRSQFEASTHGKPAACSPMDWAERHRLLLCDARSRTGDIDWRSRNAEAYIEAVLSHMSLAAPALRYNWSATETEKTAHASL